MPLNAPDIYIIGAQKAATTSLFYTLAQSNEITASKVKEPEHFTLGRANNYDSLFNGNGLKLEATPSCYSDSFLDNLYKANPECKLIYILRNPIERAWSAWKMYEKSSQVSGSFYDKCKSDIDNIDSLNEDNDTIGIIRRGHYAKHINRIIELGMQVYIVSFSRLITDPQSEIKSICNYLKIDTLNADLGKRNRSKSSAMPNNAKELLENYYESKTKELEQTICYNPY